MMPCINTWLMPRPPKLKTKDRRLWSNTFMAISSEVHRSFFRRWLRDERLNCSDHRRWRKLVMTPEFTIEYVIPKAPCSSAWSANEDVTRTAPGRFLGNRSCPVAQHTPIAGENSPCVKGSSARWRGVQGNLRLEDRIGGVPNSRED